MLRLAPLVMCVPLLSRVSCVGDKDATFVSRHEKAILSAQSFMSKIWGLLSTDSCRQTFGPTADNLSALSALTTMIYICLLSMITTRYHEENAKFYITHNMYFCLSMCFCHYSIFFVILLLPSLLNACLFPD